MLIRQEQDAIDKSFQNVLADMFENFYIVRRGIDLQEEMDVAIAHFQDDVRLLRETLTIAEAVLEQE